ncbi:MAG TPA: VOC family protein [Pseudomonadales bacterium]|nr:VOC family protein [Pseudomonadales bacterium]
MNWMISPILGASNVTRSMKYYCEACIYVDDADALHTEFVRSGARVVRGPVDNPGYGLRDFIVEDLDGNRLVFGSPLP